MEAADGGKARGHAFPTSGEISASVRSATNPQWRVSPEWGIMEDAPVALEIRISLNLPRSLEATEDQTTDHLLRLADG